MPNAESHAAYVFCCVGALAIAGALNKFDKGALSYWLSRRQTVMGGFNGRPEKLPDVCYSWWVLSSLCILKKQNEVNLKNLQSYVYQCQDDKGGISDRPGNEVDVFHTFFGLASLSLIDAEKHGLLKVNPVFAIPEVTIAKNFPHLKSFLTVDTSQL